ncbi:MAG: hypothetical protein EOP19_07630 [Hyphomicrobiales bacterium]|nr:MAG: hypothetical protein EOP19_07630 [Hyphomicrobiales bacterium]
MRFGEWLTGQARNYVWNRTTLSAVLIASPAILSSIATFAISNSLDRRSTRFAEERDGITRDLGALDGQVKSFETLQLGRGALLLVLNGSQADMQYKYLLDRLFRLNAKQAVRRMAAIVHPQDWQNRMAPYDALVDQDYSDAGTVQSIQAMENAMVLEASERLTALQLRHNIVTGRIGKVESLKAQITAILASLTSALTIVIFFVTTNRKKPEPQSAEAPAEKRQRPASVRKRAADGRDV